MWWRFGGGEGTYVQKEGRRPKSSTFYSWKPGDSKNGSETAVEGYVLKYACKY